MTRNHDGDNAQGRAPAGTRGGPYTLTVTSNGQTVSRADILVGDVYLCSGQSNMEFAVRASTNAWGATNMAGNEKIRFLNVEKNSTVAP